MADKTWEGEREARRVPVEERFLELVEGALADAKAAEARAVELRVAAAERRGYARGVVDAAQRMMEIPDDWIFWVEDRAFGPGQQGERGGETAESESGEGGRLRGED